MITQGTFALLPEFTDEEIEAQLKYAIDNEWAISVEYTDDPNPRNTFWELWDLPMFDLKDPAGALSEVKACREAHPNEYIKISAFDNARGRETIVLSFLVQKPDDEPMFRIERQGRPGRTIGYTAHSYAADKPHGERYA